MIMYADGLYTAKRIVTMDPQCPEIFEAGIVVEQGRIVALDLISALGTAGPRYDLGPVTLCPGLINAHTHLGLTHLQGQIPQGLGFEAWAQKVFSLRTRSFSPMALEKALAAMVAQGVVLVADWLGAHGSEIKKAVDLAGLHGVFFREFMGSKKFMAQGPDPGAVHALYSTAADLAVHIKAHNQAHARPFALHLAEVPGENELFCSGQGPLADFLHAHRILPKTFVPPGLRSVAWAHVLGLLDAQTLAVHCVHVNEEDLELLAKAQTSVCLCPRSNAWIGVDQAPVQDMIAAGLNLCLGTDSMASNADLNLWAELDALCAILPQPWRLGQLLALITTNPAQVLGLQEDFGLLAPGRRAQWAVVPPQYANLPL